MAEARPRTGEQIERARRTRQIGIAAGSIINEPENLRPAVAILLSAAFVVVGFVGTYFFRRTMDEHQILAQYKAAYLVLSLYVYAYPIWYLLWKAELVREPMHQIIFVAVIFASLAAAAINRFR
jgi:heme A synthase